MPRKRKKQETKLILHPSPESLNFTEEDVREKLKPLVRLLARQAAREHGEDSGGTPSPATTCFAVGRPRDAR